MIQGKSIQTAFGLDVTLSSEMIAALSKWVLMYENKAGWLGKDVKSLNLSAAISSEIARIVTIEMTVELGDSERAKYLAEQFEPVLDKIRETVEYGNAKGGLMFKPYVEDDKILVDLVHADHFYPTTFDSSKNILGAVFVDQRKIGEWYFTRLERHESQYLIQDPETMEPKATNMIPVYMVQNVAYRSKSKDTLGTKVDLSLVPDWADLESEAFIKNIDIPLFSYYKYPMANNIDSLSPLGVSCFSRAVDMIKEADLQWSRFLWENESAERALYVDTLAFARDADDKPILPNKRLYRTLETGTPESDLFHDWSPDIREESMLNGLDAILKKIEFMCGLAYGVLSDPNTVDKTATEIKASKQRTASTITDAQKALSKALDGLFAAMNAWVDMESLNVAGEYNPLYYYDDSIIVDRDSQFQQDLSLVPRVIMGKVEFRMRNMGEDEETAMKMVAKAEKENKPGSIFDKEDETDEDKNAGLTPQEIDEKQNRQEEIA